MLERDLGVLVGRHVPHRLAAELLEAEILRRLEPHDLHVRAQQRDEREKQRAVESVLVEFVRLDVRGRDHHDAVFEQPREQPPENHRVGDVGDMKFVEAQQPGFLGQRVGDMPDRVGIRDAPGLHVVAHRIEALVHVGHEFMEVRAALSLHRARGEEQIHQHGLAAADIAVDVEAPDRARGLALREQPAEVRRFSRQPVLREALFQSRKLQRNRFLRGIALDLSLEHEGGVAFGDG